MAFDINQFRASLRSEVANPTNFEVAITREPNSMSAFARATGGLVENDFANIVKFRCESCSLPSKAFKVTNMSSYGPPNKVVYATEYSDTSFTFIATDDMPEKEYLALWQESIVNNDNQNGGYNTNNITYYEDYIGEITITYFSKAGVPTYRITFVECYPVLMNETPMSWHSNNDYIKVSVNLTYKYFIEERLFVGDLPLNRLPDVGGDPTLRLGGFREVVMPPPPLPTNN